MQNPNRPLIEQLNFFHDWVIVTVVTIATAILLFLITLIRTKKIINTSLLESQNVELLWTTLPCLVLFAIGFPRLRLLYLLDEVGAPSINIKVIGHQWYWSYEYRDWGDLNFDAYITKEGPLRLLDADHRLIILPSTPTRIIITAADVLHSWTIPVLGVKADAVPGRLNQLNILVDRPGVFFGQCSEICGSNHSFMPIRIEVIYSDRM